MKKAILVSLTLIGLAIALLRPFYGLDITGHTMLGTFIIALGAWMIRPGGGTFITGTIIIFLGGSFAGLPFADLANGFASPAFWLIVPAMFFGYTLLKTGLGKRIVLGLFKNINLSYVKIFIGFFVVGIIFSMFTPTIAVRFLILTPIAAVVADACGLEKASRGRSLIILTAWTVSIFPGIAWYNGSLYGIVFATFLPESVAVTESMWLLAMAPWIPMSLAYLALLYFLLKPAEPLNISKEQLRQMYNDLGTPQLTEKKCLLAFSFLILALTLSAFIPISINQILFATFIILLISGVLDVKDISQGINWDIIAFFGVILGFNHIFNTAGISQWLAPILAELMRPIAFSPFVFVIALYVICVLIRLADAAQGFISSSIMALATPMLFQDFGIHPLVVMTVFICAANLFLFRYHQPWIGQVESALGDNGWNPKHLTKAAIAYAVFAAVFLLVCVFYWMLVGIL